MEKTCQFCKNTFQAERNRRIFCSIDCTLKSKERKSIITCFYCKKKFKVHTCRIKRGTNLYCSKQCSFTGRHRQQDSICQVCSKVFRTYIKNFAKYCSKKCFGFDNRAENNYLWKGKQANYRSQHNWIQRRLGKANFCEQCGLNKIPNGKKRFFQWANISHKYLRDTSDYKSLCLICHKLYDKKP